MAKEKLCGIYCIENKLNGKKYIGQSVNIYKRWESHIYSLKKLKHYNKYLQRAVIKDGIDSFEFKILKLCTKLELSTNEIYFIELFNSNDEQFGYNATSGGESGYEWSESKRNNHNLSTEICVLKINKDGKILDKFRSFYDANKSINVKLDNSNIRGCCNKITGRKSYHGYYWMYEYDYIENGFILANYSKIKRSKEVCRIDIKTNNILEIYASAREASKSGYNYKNISQVCNGYRKYHKGFKWEFVK